MRAGLLVTVLAVSACSGSSTPTQPTPPPPAPIPAARIVAVETKLELPTWPCDSCVYIAQGRNDGPGCAGDVRGTVRLYTTAAATTVIASDDWTLPSTQIVRPGESFRFEGCCFSRADLERITGGTYNTQFLWTDVRCP